MEDHQKRRIEAGEIEDHTKRDLPAQVEAEPLNGLVIPDRFRELKQEYPTQKQGRQAGTATVFPLPNAVASWYIQWIRLDGVAN